MALIKNGQFIENVYATLADGEALPNGAALVTLSRFLAERDLLLAHAHPIGVRLQPDQSPEALGDDIHRMAVIAIEFPKFRDGRGYSWARILRERMGFRGELRAVGDVLRDQWLFMSRCGIDAFEVRPGTRLTDFLAALGEQTVFYQSAADQVHNVFQLRHARRLRAAAE